MNNITRRAALASTLGSVLLATAAGADSVVPRLSPVPQTIKPLPFVAGSLRGLSAAMITSHHNNNYAGAVRNLIRVEQELSELPADAPPFVITALQEKALLFRNSNSLHESYFGNLGGDGKRSGSIDVALARGFAGRWDEQFRALGAGLGGGSGWVVLAIELDSGSLRNVAMTSHSQALSGALPLLSMDMYEHSYQMDFGAAVPRYLDAFFANVQWDEVNRRYERAVKLIGLT